MKKIYIIIFSACAELLVLNRARSQAPEVADTSKACISIPASGSGNGKSEAFHAHYMLYSKPSILKLIRTAGTSEQMAGEPLSSGEDKQIVAAPGQGGKVSVSINGLENQEITISVYNIIGNRVFSATFVKDSPDIISVSLDKQFQPGIYFITGRSGNRLLKQQKLMIN